MSAEVLCEDLYERLAMDDPRRLLAMLANVDLPQLTFAAEIAGACPDLPSTEIVAAIAPLLEHRSGIVREGALYGLSHHIPLPCVVMARIATMATDDPNEGVRHVAGAVYDSED